MLGYLRVLAVGSLLFTSINASALPKDFKNSCVPLSQFSSAQKEVLEKAFVAGYKSGFGYTLAAIAWQESCAGEYKMNFQDPSAGLYHAHLPGVIKKFPKLKRNGFTENMMGAFLVNNDEFATKLALDELTFWKGVHKGDWEKIIKSYNKGYRWQNEKKARQQAEYYYRNINEKVTLLKQFFSSGYNKLARKANSQGRTPSTDLFKKIEQEIIAQEHLPKFANKSNSGPNKLHLPIYNTEVQFDYQGFATLESKEENPKEQMQWYQIGNDAVREGEEKPIKIDYSKEAEKLLETMGKSMSSFSFSEYMQLYSITLEQYRTLQAMQNAKKPPYKLEDDPFDYGIEVHMASNTSQSHTEQTATTQRVEKFSLPFYSQQKRLKAVRIASIH